ncbi:MAG: thiamine-phosphate kinase [Rugosibacter sp.]|nr:thiamine-phosphate kinase [Rugosibacter sp.]
MPSEFDLIRRFFIRPTQHTLLGAGDDAALIAPTPGCELAISTDLLVEGTHFLGDTAPFDLGWKTLAVNVSDMAAMGATPRWATLAAALPAPTLDWLDAFSRGFFACAEAFNVDLIGGDTTRGPRTFCVTIMGEVPRGQALLRSGAQAGDSIWVSGTPGRAALGLAHLQGRIALTEPHLGQCLAALHRPQPRVALGLALRGLATAAIDVSDGLLADLSHILTASSCAAELHIPHLPPAGLARDGYLSGGDDYELIFTLPAEHRAAMATLAVELDLPLTCIGVITPAKPDAPGTFALHDDQGSPITPTRHGFDHFL